MLFLKKVLSAIIAFVTVLLPFGESALPERKTDPVFNGTFLQSWMSSSWDEARWAEEIELMEEDGIKYLVLQDLANKDTEGNWDVYYNSTIDAFKGADFGGDVLGNALEAVKGTDIQIFVGLTAFNNLWSTGTLTGEYNDICDITADMMEDIYNTYYKDGKDNFYGWYFTMEFSNNVFIQLGTSNVVKGLNVVLDRATEIDPSIPLMMSPFTSKYLTTGKLPALVQWVCLFTQSNWRDGDIIAPQDAVGAAWINEDDLVDIWQMYSIAVGCAEADLKLWANCENFTSAVADSFGAGLINPPASENTVSVTATLDRFTYQLDVASRYCENIITFSYNHYYSPAYVSSAYIETYRDYVANGYVLENKAPVMSASFAKSVTEDGIELIWKEAEDNIGVSHYRIMKNGEFFVRAEAAESYLDYSITDAEGTANDVYTIVAYDAAGNASAEITAK